METVTCIFFLPQMVIFTHISKFALIQLIYLKITFALFESDSFKSSQLQKNSLPT